MKGASVIEVIPRYKIFGFDAYSNAPASAAYIGTAMIPGFPNRVVILYKYMEVRARHGRLNTKPANPEVKSESIIANGRSRKCGSGIHTVPI
jgi:hypothetical protein